MTQNEFYSGEAARDGDVYRQLNVFGAPRDMTVRQGETFPSLPRLFAVLPLVTQSAHKLRKRAARDRRLTGAATRTHVRDDVPKVAQCVEAPADQPDAPSGRMSTVCRAPFPDDVIMVGCLTW